MLVLAACSGSDCVTLDADCTPAYPPTFDNIHQRTFVPSCAVAGKGCHATAGRQAGLGLEEIEEAYRSLVEEGRVLPGDATCSPTIARLESTGGDVMPPGAPLRDAERCVIAQWITNGAKR